MRQSSYVRWLFSFGIMVSCFLSAGWEESWIKAIEFCRVKGYMHAEKHFDEAIKQLMAKKDETHPHVWVDRATLFVLLQRDKEAMADLEHVSDNLYLKGNDYVRFITNRMGCHLRMGMMEEFEIDRQIFTEVFPIPKLEVYNDHVIIRNIPDIECAENMVKKYIAHVFCDSEEDVTISNGICIAKRAKKDCGCGCDPLINKGPVTNCKYWCEKAAVAGHTFCGGTFKFGPCLAACAACVEGLKEGCHWCCAGGKPYEKCIKTFADIVGTMGGICDPAWD